MNRSMKTTVIATSVAALVATGPLAPFALGPARAQSASAEEEQQRQREQMEHSRYSDQLREQRDRARERQWEQQRERDAARQVNQSSDGSAFGTVLILGGIAVFVCYIARCFDSPPNRAAAPSASPPTGAPPGVEEQSLDGLEDGVFATPTYRVVRVPSWDVLNIRHRPGGTITGEIPPGGRGVRLGYCAFDRRGMEWCFARWRNQIGWVATAYLRQE